MVLSQSVTEQPGAHQQMVIVNQSTPLQAPLVLAACFCMLCIFTTDSKALMDKHSMKMCALLITVLAIHCLGLPEMKQIMVFFFVLAWLLYVWAVGLLSRQIKTAAVNAPAWSEMKGKQGPAGPQGMEGQQGAVGPSGVPGKDGRSGAQGPEGLVGPQGEQGIDGSTGAPGAPGEQGRQGSPGAAGLPGVDGQPGPEGAEGPSGKVGVDGPQGKQGEDGLVGQQGKQGPDGDQGLRGKPGVDGKQGKAGGDGPEGPQGAQGPQGQAGLPGQDGPEGPRGPEGRQGPEGNAPPAEIREIQDKIQYFEASKQEEFLVVLQKQPGYIKPKCAASNGSRWTHNRLKAQKCQECDKTVKDAKDGAACTAEGHRICWSPCLFQQFDWDEFRRSGDSTELLAVANS